MNTMDNGCRPIGIYARYRELASGIEKVACFWELDQVFCFLRPQYEDGVIEILQIATECDVVILTDSGFSNILELDDSKVKGWCGAIIDACRRNLVTASARGSGGSNRLLKRVASFAHCDPLRWGMGATMRGDDRICGSLFSYMDLEKRIRADHPLRVIRHIANAALNSLSGEFQKLYSLIGRESIPPERLMRALLLQAFYSIRSERQLVERIDTDLLFRWFVGLGIEDAVWDATTFTKNRDRLLDGAVASQFRAAVLAQDKVKRLLSSDHFSVDGTLLEAWASPKSFRPKDGSGEPPGPGRNGEQDFHGERRTNDTHTSITDPDARLYRKGPARLLKSVG
jgi:transposase